jgi:RNA polymerase sigma-70 factor (ECF subfamily)
VTGDWDVAEESAQDAFALALERWQRDGVPRNPGAWLTTTARNRAIDRIRRAATGASKLQEVAVLSADHPSDSNESGVGDDRLRLIFTCCHPALALEAQARWADHAGDRAGVPRARGHDGATARASEAEDA